MMISLKKVFFIVLFSGLCAGARSQQFVHPGLLSDNKDIARIKAGLTAGQPDIKAGFEQLSHHPQSQFTYQLQGPLTMIGRNPTVGQGVYDSDANAAFQNALMWTITGDLRHAKKAIEIINAWSNTLTAITGRDAVLMAGLGPFKMVNAAELLRYTNSGWTENEIRRTEQHFREVIYPVIQNYAPFANGNWDSAALKTAMAIAIFCNDRQIFENTLDYYQRGAGDGHLTNYIINDSGQCQESGRDQSHTQLGIAHLADCCEMAWHQGIDLYGLQNNRLLKGFEYTAKYNLGYDVPFTPTIDRTGKYRHSHISVEGRSRLRAVYEEVYNHYVRRCGIEAPFTTMAAARLRPEPQGTPGADHTGFGTLLYSRQYPDSSTSNPPYRPAGVIATDSGNVNIITWPKIINAGYYRIQRSAKPTGPYKLLADKIMDDRFIDRNVIKGRLYYYVVAAVNPYGQSAFSIPKSINAGLPEAWQIADIGTTEDNVKKHPGTLFSTGGKKGMASYNGVTFELHGIGTGTDSLADHCTMLYRALNQSAGIIMKYIPQFSAQATQLGLTIRNDHDANAAGILLLLRPVLQANPESPGWQLQFLKRLENGRTEVIATSEELKSPVVTFGRMTGPVWLKINKAGNHFTSSYSVDGRQWIPLGKDDFNAGTHAVAGVLVASGSKLIDTQVTIAELKLLKTH
ncbi:alginate lyase family protein [Mucilaginibacter angelicae]|uniref:Alginate lyase family protein n=1 Tax=Mucilaginibacter angelicae TaxID=869718 RepID=A0ABV6LF21_9SPHI